MADRRDWPRRCRTCPAEIVANRDGINAVKCRPCRDAAQIVCAANRRAAYVKPSVRAAVIARDGMVCQYCFRPVRQPADRYDRARDTIEIDHLIPAMHGGEGTATNLVVACGRCNRRRTARMRRAA